MAGAAGCAHSARRACTTAAPSRPRWRSPLGPHSPWRPLATSAGRSPQPQHAHCTPAPQHGMLLQNSGQCCDQRICISMEDPDDFSWVLAVALFCLLHSCTIAWLSHVRYRDQVFGAVTTHLRCCSQRCFLPLWCRHTTAG